MKKLRQPTDEELLKEARTRTRILGMDTRVELVTDEDEGSRIDWLMGTSTPADPIVSLYSPTVEGDAYALYVWQYDPGVFGGPPDAWVPPDVSEDLLVDGPDPYTLINEAIRHIVEEHLTHCNENLGYHLDYRDWEGEQD